MWKSFLKKYQYYCKERDLRVEILKMVQKEDEIIEDYVKCFQYNIQRSKHHKLDHETLKIILLRGI